MIQHPIDRVTVLGGGSAGFMAALAVKAKLPNLHVSVIRSRDIGIIGVGEGSTVPLTKFLHGYLGIAPEDFHAIARPTWKLGLRFLWGPRPHFFYTFTSEQPHMRVEGLPRSIGFYSADDEHNTYDAACALMAADKVFERGPDGRPMFPPHYAYAYHFENENFVEYLEAAAEAIGVRIVDGTVSEVTQGEQGVTGLVLKSGAVESADLYVDASGFGSLLLGKALNEPFISFKSSLFCDRAVVGGWARTDEVIRPYTTCETMDSGWCWQIEHETRINRGYVYSSSFISDDDAEREFRAKNSKIGPMRVVRFVSGCHQRGWVKNVVAIGNASGFVEPLEATALGVIAIQSWSLADTLRESGRQPTPSLAAAFNRYHAINWSAIRGFIALHYKFNTRLDTAFWRECREKTDLAGAEGAAQYYKENGPGTLWREMVVDPADQFGLGGYHALLLGMGVPHNRPHVPTPQELATWQARRRRHAEAARRAMSVREALDVIRPA